jgi:hypothetical protein
VCPPLCDLGPTPLLGQTYLLVITYDLWPHVPPVPCELGFCCRRCQDHLGSAAALSGLLLHCIPRHRTNLSPFAGSIHPPPPLEVQALMRSEASRIMKPDGYLPTLCPHCWTSINRRWQDGKNREARRPPTNLAPPLLNIDQLPLVRQCESWSPTTICRPCRPPLVTLSHRGSVDESFSPFAPVVTTCRRPSATSFRSSPLSSFARRQWLPLSCCLWFVGGNLIHGCHALMMMTAGHQRRTDAHLQTCNT